MAKSVWAAVSQPISTCPGCGGAHENKTLRIPSDPGPDRRWYAYAHCDACQTLTLTDAPPDGEAEYGEGYYSMSAQSSGRVKRLAVAARNAVQTYGPDPVATLTERLSEHPVLPRLRPILRGDFGRKIGRHDAWLDIGCGSGALLRDMADIGFTDLTGADPYVPRHIVADGISLFRSPGIDLPRRFDCVMMNHSLEHVAKPEITLAGLHDILEPGGVVLIRIPLVGLLFSRYGGEWGNLDAPRHLTLWSANGFRRAAERAGWRIARTTFDAKPRSIYASEGRLRGLSEHRDDVRAAFTKAEHRQFGAEIRRMNRAGVSDTAAFYLTQL